MLEDFEESLNEGIVKGIFTTDIQLTTYGEEIYLVAIKKLKYLQKEYNNLDRYTKVKNIAYVPKTFKGRS